MKRWKAYVKVLLAVAVLWFIRDKFDLEHFVSVVGNPLLLLVVPLSWAMNQVFTTMRLHAMLKALGRDTQLSDIFRANFSSLFMGNMMPGVMGADVVKFFYLKRHDKGISNTQLGLVLGLDRFFGLLSILFWCSIFSLAIDASDYTNGTALLLIRLPIILLVALLAGFLIIGLVVRYVRRFNLPPVAKNLTTTYALLISTKQKKLLAMILFHNLMAVLVLLAGLATVGGFLHDYHASEPMIVMQLFLIPLSLVVSMLPLTPMGVGVVQVTMGGAYSLFGLDPHVGVSVSTISQIGLAAVSVFIGGPFFFLGNRAPGQGDNAL